jgi:hypothetical protein
MMDLTKYYTSIDEPVLNEFCKNDYVRLLLELSAKTKLDVLQKKYKRWIIKDKYDIITQCKKIKRKEIKQTMNLLTKLADKIQPDALSEIKELNTQLEDKINDINMIIDHISSSEEEYIECYSNC